MLTFQKLDVYRCSIEFAAIATDFCKTIPRGHAEVRDQLRRAAFSVPLNIAEGTGRVTAADGARHFAIARGSAMECAAVLDIVRLLGVGTDEQHRQAVELLGRMVSMLSKLSR
jgi:four helix bundle protein